MLCFLCKLFFNPDKFYFFNSLVAGIIFGISLILFGLYKSGFPNTVRSLLISGGIAGWEGSSFGWVIGCIVFCIGFVSGLKWSFALDSAGIMYEDHHRRNDERADM